MNKMRVRECWTGPAQQGSVLRFRSWEIWLISTPCYSGLHFTSGETGQMQRITPERVREAEVRPSSKPSSPNGEPPRTSALRTKLVKAYSGVHPGEAPGN